MIGLGRLSTTTLYKVNTKKEENLVDKIVAKTTDFKKKCKFLVGIGKCTVAATMLAWVTECA